jgi:hypothetical protein
VLRRQNRVVAQVSRAFLAMSSICSAFSATTCFGQTDQPPDIEISQSPSPGVAGFSTYFFDVVPAVGTTISSVDGHFATTIPGTMRQVNPSNLATVFTNNNAAIVNSGENPDADSQFEFNSGDAVLVFDAVESSTQLSAALGGLQPLTTKFTLAHVVVADDVTGMWTIGVVQRDATGIGREYHLSGVFGPELTVLQGDYNNSGVIDAADYVVWRHTLGQTGEGLAADGNGNQAIDADDYAVWRSRFGISVGGKSAVDNSNVPEPATEMMLFAGVLLILGGNVHRYFRTACIKSSKCTC